MADTDIGLGTQTGDPNMPSMDLDGNIHYSTAADNSLHTEMAMQSMDFHRNIHHPTAIDNPFNNEFEPVMPSMDLYGNMSDSAYNGLMLPNMPSMNLYGTINQQWQRF